MKRTNKPTVHAIILDDLVFANKNKEYGAYMLRRLYSRHISIALALSVLIFSASTIIPVLVNHWRPDVTDIVKKGETGIMIFVNPILNNPIVEKVLPGKPLSPVKATVQYRVPVVTNNPIDENQSMATVDELKKATPGYTTQNGDPDGIDNPIDAVNSKPPVETRVERPEPIVTFSEQMPAYDGGEGELFAFMARNIHYPELAVKAGIEGRVLVQFIVEKDGSLSDFTVVKGIGAGCDEEALRVCRLLTAWHAGLQNGKAVRVRMIIPIMFRLR